MENPTPAALAVQASAEIAPHEEAPLPVVPLQEVVAPQDAAAPWRVIGAAVRGVSHERLNMPCQDAQGARILPDGTLIIALADGAGSARFSEVGARRAVEAGLRALETALQEAVPAEGIGWGGLLRGTFTAAREAVLQQAVEDSAARKDAGADTEANPSQDHEDDATAAAEEPEYPVEREYASTLTCVVASGDRLVVGQVGDGAVVAVDENGEVFAVTRLQRGEYANETHFITQPDMLDQLVIDVVERPVSALAVMSDGLIRLALKMPAQEPHAPFFQPLFRFTGSFTEEADAVRQLENFLNSERVNARTDDDKSLVMAARQESVRQKSARQKFGQQKEAQIEPQETSSREQDGE